MHSCWPLCFIICSCIVFDKKLVSTAEEMRSHFEWPIRGQANNLPLARLGIYTILLLFDICSTFDGVGRHYNLGVSFTASNENKSMTTLTDVQCKGPDVNRPSKQKYCVWFFQLYRAHFALLFFLHSIPFAKRRFCLAYDLSKTEKTWYNNKKTMLK